MPVFREGVGFDETQQKPNRLVSGWVTFLPTHRQNFYSYTGRRHPVAEKEKSLSMSFSFISILHPKSRAKDVIYYWFTTRPEPEFIKSLFLYLS